MPSLPSKNKKLNGYNSMPKNNKRDKKSLFKSKRKKIIKTLHDSKTKKDRKIEKIEKILYERKEKDYYKPIKINNAFNDNYIEYQSNGNKDKILSVK